MVSVPGCLEGLLFGLLLSPALVNYFLKWNRRKDANGRLVLMGKAAERCCMGSALWG